MKILKPKIVNQGYSTPQCEAPIGERDGYNRLNKSWQKEGFVPTQCNKASTIEINGHHYCRQHAGQIALDWWANGKLVEAKPESASRRKRKS